MALDIVKDRGGSRELQAIFIAGLVESDAWSLLVTLAETMGQDQLAAEFREALAREEDHVARLRAWLQDCLKDREDRS
jgi:rubrerythrin